MICQIIGIATRLWNELRALDRRRNKPIRAEDYVPHVIREHGRLRTHRLADDYSHRQVVGRLTAHRMQPKFGNVDDDWRLGEIRRYPAISFQRELEVLHAGFERHVQFGHGALAQHAVDIEAMATLEMFHGADDGSVVNGRVSRHVGIGWKVAELTQSRDQLRHRRKGISGTHTFLRYRYERSIARARHLRVGEERIFSAPITSIIRFDFRDRRWNVRRRKNLRPQ